MNIIYKSNNGKQLIPIESSLLSENRICFIEGEITQDSAIQTCKELLYLIMSDAETAIDIVINSPGGEVSAGLMILDTIINSPVEIRTWCWGEAFSMGAILFAAGRRRYMFEHAQLMLHQPLISSHFGGNVSAIRAVSDSLLETSYKLNEILSSITGKTVCEIEEIIRTDHYFDAIEAIEFGLADEIGTIGMITEKEGIF